MLLVFYNILQIYFFFQNIPTSPPARTVVGRLLRPDATLTAQHSRLSRLISRCAPRFSPRCTRLISHCTPRFSQAPRAWGVLHLRAPAKPRTASHPSPQRHFTSPACAAAVGHLLSNNALPSKRPSAALFAEVRNASRRRTCLPGPSRALSSFLLPTHFRPNGLLWHFLRKCVTPFRPEPASQALRGHLREQIRRKTYSRLPLGASERTKMAEIVLLAALGDICANKNAPKRTLGCPRGHHVRYRTSLSGSAKCLPPVLLGCESVFPDDVSPARTGIVQILSLRGAEVTG